MNNQVDVTAAASNVLDQEAKNREALKYLLDFYLDGDRVLAEKTEMGGTESFVASVPLRWVEANVGFASQLPLFQEKLDPKTKQIIIDQSTIDIVQQRPLDWSRQAALAQYLAARKNHKFPPILAVMTYAWVDKPKADEWDSEGRAIRASADFLPLDSKGRVGLLDVSEKVSLYALDGQHRLMGIKGLMKLITEGFLPRKKKDGSQEQGRPLTVEDLTKYGVSRPYLQSLAAERIGIEFIPAVVPGETRQQAYQRVRSVFVHVNLLAAPLTKGQLDQA